LIISRVILDTLDGLNLKFPVLGIRRRKELRTIRQLLAR
jgi:hypothetical protein